jgi:hypothetical protein
MVRGIKGLSAPTDKPPAQPDSKASKQRSPKIFHTILLLKNRLPSIFRLANANLIFAMKPA